MKSTSVDKEIKELGKDLEVTTAPVVLVDLYLLRSAELVACAHSFVVCCFDFAICSFSFSKSECVHVHVRVCVCVCARARTSHHCVIAHAHVWIHTNTCNT
jgi:hypothetical protein